VSQDVGVSPPEAAGPAQAGPTPSSGASRIAYDLPIQRRGLLGDTAPPALLGEPLSGRAQPSGEGRGVCEADYSISQRTRIVRGYSQKVLAALELALAEASRGGCWRGGDDRARVLQGGQQAASAEGGAIKVGHGNQVTGEQIRRNRGGIKIAGHCNFLLQPELAAESQARGLVMAVGLAARPGCGADEGETDIATLVQEQAKGVQQRLGTLAPGQEAEVPDSELAVVCAERSPNRLGVETGRWCARDVAANRNPETVVRGAKSRLVSGVDKDAAVSRGCESAHGEPPKGSSFGKEVRHHQVVKGHQYAHSRSPQSKPEREQIDGAAQLKRARLILDVHQVGAAGSYRLLDAPPGMNAPVANVGPDMRPRHGWHRPKVAGQDENGEAELLERRCQPGTVIADATGQRRKLASDHQDAWEYVPVPLALLGH